MKITDSYAVPFGVDRYWDAILDPAVLVRTIPGCERLEETGEHAYAMTVTAGVAAIKGTYTGTCELSDLVPHESLVMRLRGAGAPGTVDATVRVAFSGDESSTRVEYDADAVVGGMVGGVGQRMLASVSRRMAKEFFDNVAESLAGQGVRAGRGVPAGRGGRVGRGVPAGREGMPDRYLDDGTVPARPGVHTAPAPAGPGASGDFLKGIAVGAGLVLLGVVAGSVLGRRP